MDLDPDDTEKDFPGFFADLSGNKKKDESDASDAAEHDKLSKKDLLIGRKKDKKDRGYATLAGESSPEEEPETKSPSKSAKKVKSFKFSSKSREKREKSRDKEKLEKDVKDKDKDSLDGKDKKKEKDKKDKDKKEKHKDKEKEKKDKKVKQLSVSEDLLDLGDAQPIFGVSLGLAVERSRCHDNIELPLVVRDCIDYLQEQGILSEQLYKADVVRTRLFHLKKAYNNRESNGSQDFDVPTACSLLKMFLKELPEPVLTTDLTVRFEEAASIANVTQQEQEFLGLVEQLPSLNRILLAWLLLHFDSVIQNEKSNKINAQNLAMLLSPTLQMSHRLLVAMLCHCANLFPNDHLHTYIPPITASSPNLPETVEEITKELRKQESLLSQIHAEMNAGFITKKREEQLWEVQRIVTQLKRKLRSFEKKNDGDISFELSSISKVKSICSDDEGSLKTSTVLSMESVSNADAKLSPPVTPEETLPAAQSESLKLSDRDLTDKFFIGDNGMLLCAETHPEYGQLVRLQLENQELVAWKAQLQARINSERAEVVRLKRLVATADSGTTNNFSNLADKADHETLIAHYVQENALLQQKKITLSRQIVEENHELIQMLVSLQMKKFKV